MTEALDAFTQGRSAVSIRCFAASDQALTARLADAPGASEIMQMRASILAVSEGLSQHAEYFDAGALK